VAIAQRLHPVATNYVAARILAGLAVAWGLLLIPAAIAVPAYTPNSSAGTYNPQTQLITYPRITLFKEFGYPMLFVAAIPLVLAILIGLLIETSLRRGTVDPLLAAWVLSALLLIGGVIGLLTILIGVALVPVGVLLLAACGTVSKLEP